MRDFRNQLLPEGGIGPCIALLCGLRTQDWQGGSLMVQFPRLKRCKQLKQPVGDRFAHKLDVMRFERMADDILHLAACLKADRAFWPRIRGERGSVQPCVIG